MSEILTGWVHGRTISLDADAPELEGQRVEVVLRPIEASAPADPEAVASGEPWTGDAEMRWLNEHSADYAGQWVVLDGDRLIASGREAKPLLEEARRLGIETPFLTLVQSDPDAPSWGGWV
jgi:hypothetical protein